MKYTLISAIKQDHDGAPALMVTVNANNGVRDLQTSRAYSEDADVKASAEDLAAYLTDLMALQDAEAAKEAPVPEVLDVSKIVIEPKAVEAVRAAMSDDALKVDDAGNLAQPDTGAIVGAAT